MHPAAPPSPGVAFKKASLKAIREFGSFEHELPILLPWCHANKSLTFLHHKLVSVNWLCCAVGEWTQVPLGNNTDKESNISLHG